MPAAGPTPASRRPLVSVVIPARNAAAYLPASLASLWGQSFDDFEVLVVDDGSTDGTLELLAGQSDRRLRVLQNDRGAGIAGALNTGLAAATGRYIARMDADDVSVSSRLAVQVSLLEAPDGPDVVGSNVAYMTQDGRLTGRRSHLPTGTAGVRLHLHVGNCLPHPTVVARREVLEAADGYRSDRPAGEDYDLWLRLLPHARMANVATPLLQYRVHPENTSSRQQYEGALSVAATLASLLSELLAADVTPEVVMRLLLPNRPVTSSEAAEEVLAVATVLDGVVSAARAEPGLAAQDLRAVRRRCDDVLARLLVSMARSHAPALPRLVRTGRTGIGAARGLAIKGGETARAAWAAARAR